MSFAGTALTMTAGVKCMTQTRLGYMSISVCMACQGCILARSDEQEELKKEQPCRAPMSSCRCYIIDLALQ